MEKQIKPSFDLGRHSVHCFLEEVMVPPRPSENGGDRRHGYAL